MADFAPFYPGETLAEDYLPEYGLSQCGLAEAIHVSPGRIDDIILGRRGITPDTSIRLGRLFGQSDTFWVNMQVYYFFEVAPHRRFGHHPRHLLTRAGGDPTAKIDPRT